MRGGGGVSTDQLPFKDVVQYLPLGRLERGGERRGVSTEQLPFKDVAIATTSILTGWAVGLLRYFFLCGMYEVCVVSTAVFDHFHCCHNDETVFCVLYRPVDGGRSLPPATLGLVGLAQPGSSGPSPLGRDFSRFEAIATTMVRHAHQDFQYQ